MKVLHIVPYLPKASGVTTFVDEVSKQLVAKGVGCAVCVETVDCFGMTKVEGVPRISVDEGLRRLNDFEVIHIHGIWRPCMHKFVVAARKFKKPIVWSLHGMLSPWAMKFKRWKKLPVWWLWQKRDLKYAAILHVTSEKEAEWVRAYGFDNKIVNIPLGAYLPSEIPDLRGKDKTLLFVGRMNPVKGLDNLIRAWKMFKSNDETLGWHLRLVGTDEMNYQKQLQRLAEEIGVGASVEFVGPQFGEELKKEYLQAAALILPSHTENFGGVVVDAMAYGLPVIASRGTPWAGLVEHKCGWWVDNSPESLADALKKMTRCDLRDWGKRGREWVRSEFSWEVVGENIFKIYCEVSADASAI